MTVGSGAGLRFVAMLDVLGFRGIEAEHGMPWIGQRYRVLERIVRSLSKWEVRTTFFSDTLLVYSAHPLHVGPDLEAWVLSPDAPCPAQPSRLDLYPLERLGDAFLNFTAHFVAKAFSVGLPLRGGIALGMTDLVPTRDIYLGQAIIDAYETESRQDWPGIGLHESCYRWTDAPWVSSQVRNTPLLWPRGYRWDVPIKTGAPIEWTLNWMQGVGADLEGFIERNRGTPFERRWLALHTYFEDVKVNGPQRPGGEEGNGGAYARIFGPKYWAH